MKSEKFITLWEYFRAKQNDPSTELPALFKRQKNDPPGLQQRPKVLSVFLNYGHYLLHHTRQEASFDEYWTKKEWYRSEEYRSSKEYKASIIFHSADYPEISAGIKDYREIISTDIDVTLADFKRWRAANPPQKN